MKHRPYIIAAGVLIGLFVLFFAELLLGGRLPAFRDAAHFYPPLFDFCRDEWAAGRVPLWNPYENFGQPLLADATSSVFYPGKLLYGALPGDWAWLCYLLMHLPLAALGVWLLARRYGASIEAAALAAATFTFSGAVLGDVCNVVFLIGAAWLPWAMLATERMLIERSIRWAIGLGVVLALMVLGGDPQMAYTAALLTAIRCLYGRNVAHPPPAVPIPVEQPRADVLHSRLGLLALAALCGVILSAVQILPSVEFARESTRASVPLAERLSARAAPEGHLEEVYQFSVGPWRFAEMLWPNVAGTQYPIHRRWLSELPAEGRIWTPTLYMGVLTLLLSLTAMRFRHDKRPPAGAEEQARAPATFLSWIAIFAILASFGWYGLGWLFDELATALGFAPLQVVGKPFGGVYWLMTVVLPGYVQFRYPAKLLVVAALMLALLAAAGFDRQFTQPNGRLRRVLGFFGLASAAACLAAMAIRPFWATWFATAAPDAMFGPLDVEGAWRDVATGFLQSSLVAASGYWLLGHRRALGHFSRVVPPALLALVAVDLLLANRWLIASAPVELWHAPSPFAAAIRAAANDKNVAQRTLGFASPVRPSWRTTSSTDRLAEAVCFQRDTLWPKFNLSERIALSEVYGTMMLADWETVCSIAPESQDCVSRLAPWSILPLDAPPPEADARIVVETSDARLWFKPSALPRTWIAREPHLARPAEGESCVLKSESPECLELYAELRNAGTLVLADPFFPGWTASVASDGAPPRAVPIEKVLGALRAVQLPAGRHTVMFRYEPASFSWGWRISLLGWAVLLAWRIGLYLVCGRSPRAREAVA